jgi:hypothetical protein
MGRGVLNGWSLEEYTLYVLSFGYERFNSSHEYNHWHNATCSDQ